MKWFEPLVRQPAEHRVRVHLSPDLLAVGLDDELGVGRRLVAQALGEGAGVVLGLGAAWAARACSAESAYTNRGGPSWVTATRPPSASCASWASLSLPIALTRRSRAGGSPTSMVRRQSSDTRGIVAHRHESKSAS